MAGLTVLYDEGCGFCTALAAWLERHGREVEPAPIGSALGDILLRDLDPEARYAAFHAVDPLGRRRSGGGALSPVLERLPGGAPASALAASFPRVADAVYRCVAANRRRLSRLLRAR